MLDLAIWPAPILKKKTELIVVFDNELEFLADQMFETMYAHKGIGLAANQVNLDKRMLVMDVDDNPIVMVNPIILESSKEIEKDLEGCLSFSGFLVEVERSKWIIVKYQNLLGEIIQKKFENLEARCANHEIEHLNGITFLRYISKQHRELIQNKLRKRHRGY